MIHPVVGGGGLAYLKPIEGLSTKAKKRYPRRGSTKSAKGKREPRRGRKDREEPPPPHQPSPGGSASATPPQGGSDPEEQTGNILYTINREHGLHLAKVSGKEDCAGLNITPPLRGSRREGGARSRAGGGQTPRSVSDYQRRVGSVVLGTLIQSGGDGRGRARLCAGGTPALPGSSHPMTSSHPGHKVADAFGCRLPSKESHLSSGPFVSIRGSSSLNDQPFFLA